MKRIVSYRDSDPSIIYGWDETQDEAIERTKRQYVNGLTTLKEMEYRLTRILEDIPAVGYARRPF